jgi:hypothetical protein
MDMTEEQVETELAHWEMDKKIKDGKGEEYEDPEFDKYDQETDEDDAKSSYEYEPDGAKASEEAHVTGTKEDEWEDVETDDLQEGSEVHDPEYD